VTPGRRPNAKAVGKGTFIDQALRLGDRRRLDTVVVPTVNDADAVSGAEEHRAGGRGEIMSLWALGGVWSQV
jgi:hypothetical protein